MTVSDVELKKIKDLAFQNEFSEKETIAFIRLVSDGNSIDKAIDMIVSGESTCEVDSGNIKSEKMDDRINDEIGDLTFEKAWDISVAFGEFLVEMAYGYNSLYEFEDMLPYKKSVILLALVEVLKEVSEENVLLESGQKLRDIKENIASLIATLDGFIPNEETYKEMLSTKKFMGEKVERLKKEKDIDENSNVQRSFKNNLLAVANSIRESNGIAWSGNIQVATVTIVTQIVSLVLQEPCCTTEGEIKKPDAVKDAIFLCFVGFIISGMLKSEGVVLVANDVIGESGSIIFKHLGSEMAAEVTRQGADQVTTLNKHDYDNINKDLNAYVGKLDTVIHTYIMTQTLDDLVSDSLKALYVELLNYLQ